MDEEDARTPGSSTPKARNGHLSPVPPKPVNENNQPRPSLDGETIFAVGEDADKWSDDDESPRNSGERQNLTGSHS